MTAASTATWQALGSTAVVRVSAPWELAGAVEIVRRELEAIDAAASRFRDDSDLARVNARAGEPVTVSPLLIDALSAALRGAELTGGALDPTIGRALEQAGYDRDWDLIPAVSDRPGTAPVVTATPRPAWRRVRVDRASGTVEVPSGVKLDLGATAKALAADRACRSVHERLRCGVLVALGGDLAARGRTPQGGWQVHVTDDHRAGADAPGQRISIEGGGLATSSTAVRTWTRAGRRMHHIIDPATGEPARTRWRTVSVAAADCTDANIASTAALLREDAASWLAGLGLPARLVEHDGRVLTVAGWPQEQDGGALLASEVAA